MKIEFFGGEIHHSIDSCYWTINIRITGMNVETLSSKKMYWTEKGAQKALDKFVKFIENSKK